MPARRCINPKCRRLIYDTEKLDELPDKIECQHCHRINVHRRIKKLTTPEPPVQPEPKPEPSLGDGPSGEGFETEGDSDLPAPGTEELTEEEPVETTPGKEGDEAL